MKPIVTIFGFKHRWEKRNPNCEIYIHTYQPQGFMGGSEYTKKATFSTIFQSGSGSVLWPYTSSKHVLNSWPLGHGFRPLGWAYMAIL